MKEHNKHHKHHETNNRLGGLLEKLLADWEQRYPTERHRHSHHNHHHDKENHHGKYE